MLIDISQHQYYIRHRVQHEAGRLVQMQGYKECVNRLRIGDVLKAHVWYPNPAMGEIRFHLFEAEQKDTVLQLLTVFDVHARPHDTQIKTLETPLNVVLWLLE
jgi:hypothetical protein